MRTILAWALAFLVLLVGTLVTGASYCLSANQMADTTALAACGTVAAICFISFGVFVGMSIGAKVIEAETAKLLSEDITARGTQKDIDRVLSIIEGEK